MSKDSRIRRLATYNDVSNTYRKIYNEDGKTIFFKEYAYWQNMNTRCNNPEYALKFPTYQGVSMGEDFKDYNMFVNWCRSCPQFYNNGWVLDKDILESGNKVYTGNLCTFVPPELNGFFIMRRFRRNKELPIGVSWCSSEGKYKVYCSQLNGKNRTIGRFLDVDLAAKAYVDYKNSLSKELISRWNGKVDDRVIKTLKSYDVRDYITHEVTYYNYQK